MTRRFILFALLVLFAFSATARADDPTPPAPLEKQRLTGAQIYYLGKYDTLDGWVMVRGGKPEFYYATPGGKAIVLGVLFDDQGTMLTPNQMISLQQKNKDDLLNMVTPSQPAAAPATATPAVPVAPATDAATANPAAPAVTTDATVPQSPSERLLSTMKDAPGILWGRADAPTFYGFLDPNCPHCQRFLREIEPYVISGRVAVRMVLVGFNDDSLKQAAFLLAASDGPDRMVRYAKGDTTAIPVGNSDVTAVVNNVALMQAWNLTATPIILYRGAADQKIRLIRGRPLDVPATVNDLTPTP